MVFQVVSYAQEILQLLSAGSQQEESKTEETVMKIREKIDKAKGNVQRTLDGEDFSLCGLFEA